MMWAEEIAVPVVLSASVAAVIICFTRRHFDLRRERILAEAALRQQEMEKGFPPGTYSTCTSGKRMDSKQAAKAGEAWNGAEEKAEREDLERGIEGLRTRMANIDTILREEKEKRNI